MSLPHPILNITVSSEIGTDDLHVTVRPNRPSGRYSITTDSLSISILTRLINGPDNVSEPSSPSTASSILTSAHVGSVSEHSPTSHAIDTDSSVNGAATSDDSHYESVSTMSIDSTSFFYDSDTSSVDTNTLGTSSVNDANSHSDSPSAMSVDSTNSSDGSGTDINTSANSDSVELGSSILFTSYEVEITGYPSEPKQFFAKLPGKVMVIYKAPHVYVYVGLRASVRPLIVLPVSAGSSSTAFRDAFSVWKIDVEYPTKDVEGWIKNVKARLDIGFLRENQFQEFKRAIRVDVERVSTASGPEWSTFATIFRNIDVHFLDNDLNF
ncbi:hypothetical protein VKT23_015921 [Stygiomarasmius scandens]|uniref:Uncharacterized protein n=1 Tax=Marasmiellus scandens TaxID=2682957 RepID=A0ABR1IZJ9_9AGAR